MAGLTPNPDRERFIELTRQITIAGGKPMTAQHRGEKLEYPAAVSDAARGLAEKDATTCGCGDTRMVTLAYDHEGTSHDGETVFKQQRRYIACVNCDAVHLQPRYIYGA